MLRLGSFHKFLMKMDQLKTDGFLEKEKLISPLLKTWEMMNMKKVDNKTNKFHLRLCLGSLNALSVYVLGRGIHDKNNSTEVDMKQQCPLEFVSQLIDKILESLPMSANADKSIPELHGKLLESFYFKYATKNICSGCNNEVIVEETSTNNICLHVPNYRKKRDTSAQLSMQEAFESFCSKPTKEKINCSNCNRNLKHDQRVSFISDNCPKLLFLTLHNVSDDPAVLHGRKVRISLNLDISKCCEQLPQKKKFGTNYALLCVEPCTPIMTAMVQGIMWYIFR